MKTITERIRHSTSGSGDLVNITGEISDILKESKLEDGSLIVFVVGSTAAITTFEYEPGMIEDMRQLCEKLIPSDKSYRHDETWGDANGYSHLRASLFGPSLVIPFEGGRLLLGTWQQVVLAEFDNRPRHREVIVQLAGK